MKKLFLLIMAIAAFTLTSCSGSGEKASGSAATSNQQQGATDKSNEFVGANFTMTYPEILVKETYKSDNTINATNKDGDVKMDATFGEMPCKPEDFGKYSDNLKIVNKDYTPQAPKIDGNIMTMKFVKDDKAQTQFSVFIDEKAGVAGKFEYPLSKAEQVEELIMPMLKSIKKK